MSTEACSAALSNKPLMLADIARGVGAFYVLLRVISTSILAEMFQTVQTPCGMRAAFVTPELQVVENAAFRRRPLSGKLCCADLNCTTVFSGKKTFVISYKRLF